MSSCIDGKSSTSNLKNVADFMLKFNLIFVKTAC